MELRGGGILFYLAASSASVSEALDNLVRYIATTNEALVGGVLRNEGEAVLTIRPIPEFDEPRRQHSEFIALWVLRTLQRVTRRDFTASLITFAHSRSSDLGEVQRLLRCPLAFAQADDSWVLSKPVIDLPIVSEDSYLLQILRAHADDQLAERRTSTGLQGMVENQLLSLLPSGRVRAPMVAQHLGMSARSLTRLLAREGTTFGEILDRLRQRLALRYVADSRMSLQQIAWSLGYSEIGAFNHSFKRWTGTSPGRARRQPFDNPSA
jgi:AraC-like DNA-binding protein